MPHNDPVWYRVRSGPPNSGHPFWGSREGFLVRGSVQPDGLVDGVLVLPEQQVSPIAGVSLDRLVQVPSTSFVPPSGLGRLSQWLRLWIWPRLPDAPGLGGTKHMP